MDINLKTVPVPAFRFSSTASLELLLGKRRGAVGKGDPERRNCEQRGKGQRRGNGQGLGEEIQDV